MASTTSHTYADHVLRLPDGIEISYTDSGAPNSSEYTTVVIIHGLIFNGYGFTPLHSLAHQQNLRLLCCNRRGYPGSTPFTDTEMEDLREGHKVFQDRLALQLAWFLRHFTQNEHISRVNEHRDKGGFVLVGWSLGNATTLSLLADPTVITGELYDAIEPYLRTLVMYDPPFLALGYTAPLPVDQTYNPRFDPSIAPEDVYEHILVWLSAFYDHPDIASGKASGVNWGKPGRDSTPTFECYTEEHRGKWCSEFPVALETDFPVFEPKMQALLQTQTQAVLGLSESSSHIATTYFPRVDILYLSGSKTIYHPMWAYMETVRMCAEAPQGRPIRFVLVEGANHFVECNTCPR